MPRKFPTNLSNFAVRSFPNSFAIHSLASKQYGRWLGAQSNRLEGSFFAEDFLGFRHGVVLEFDAGRELDAFASFPWRYNRLSEEGMPALWPRPAGTRGGKEAGVGSACPPTTRVCWFAGVVGEFELLSDVC
jgi:hypothetical protein